MVESSSEMNQEFLSALDSFDEIGVGSKVKGEVLKVEENSAIIGIEGSGAEGLLTSKEYSNNSNIDLRDEIRVGEQLDLVIVGKLNAKHEAGSYVLSKKRIDSQKVWEDLQIDFDNKARFEVTVTSAIKSGLLVSVKGIRGFIPASLISEKFVKDLNSYVGKTMIVEISELDKTKNRLVLNHRIIEKEEQQKIIDEVYGKLLPGDVIEGKVRRLTSFGAFIDLGGIDGLVHISEISYKHIDKPSEVLEVGQDIKVKVLEVNKENNKIALSLKALEKSPWEQAKDSISVNSILKGKVKRLTDFGAFVEVLPGVEGLVHVSEISWDHIKVPADVLSKDEEVDVKVINFDADNRRLGLSIKQLKENPNQKEEIEEAEDFEIPEETHGFSLEDVMKKED